MLVTVLLVRCLAHIQVTGKRDLRGGPGHSLLPQRYMQRHQLRPGDIPRARPAHQPEAVDVDQMAAGILSKGTVAGIEMLPAIGDDEIAGALDGQVGLPVGILDRPLIVGAHARRNSHPHPHLRGIHPPPDHGSGRPLQGLAEQVFEANL